MSNPVLWWRQRLQQQFPLNQVLWQEGYSYKKREGQTNETWPARVSRHDLYKDYVLWVDGNNAIAWPHLEKEDRRPLPVSELIFYSTLNPFFYMGNKARMVRNYHVKEQRLFEGRYITVKKRRYFIRLAPWQEHVTAFLRETGTKIL